MTDRIATGKAEKANYSRALTPKFQSQNPQLNPKPLNPKPHTLNPKLKTLSPTPQPVAKVLTDRIIPGNAADELVSAAQRDPSESKVSFEAGFMGLGFRGLWV